MEESGQVSKRKDGAHSKPTRAPRATHRPGARRTARPARGSGAHERERRKNRKKKALQETLPFRSWGGARKGAGRKRSADRPRIPHRPRERHMRSAPVQVTSRLVPGLRSLRNAEELAIVRDALARSQRDEFQVVHHSIQSNHLHLIVEADDRVALTSGLRGLLVRIAGALNRLWQRRGNVFADRFHERELRTPREVRNSLLYVLQNARKHGIWMRGPDPCSSGVEFDGWEAPLEHAWRPERARAPIRACGLRRGAKRLGKPSSAQSSQGRAVAQPTATRALLRCARTWLLGVGWQRHGLLRESEVPLGAFGRIACQA